MKRLKFLLVDDSPSTNFFNEIMIKKTAEYEEIQIAKNGEDALERLNSSFIPDVILLDINMPIMNGWEFLEEFQNLDARFDNTMIILMLGAKLSTDQKELITTIPNVRGCIEKMLTKDMVINIVTKFREKTLLNKCESILD
ncbi:response regulator [Aquimarina gracilis]|uniref:Response regulator n=1 Tax=Aquimarina gracilis TaxID=874422 RepID=A0ABU5ZVV2_9FLAO|nr:response regulator [Aquimarina gracilis]MEB3346004.1 response regulator [Aquimarina gracilis]